MKYEKIDINDLLTLQRQENILLLDVRSPAEFEAGHIPCAVNLPLLDNEERHQVGSTYKQEGKNSAVLKGFELTGKKFAGYISKALLLSKEKKVFLYCWRGGMRSEIMAWLLSTAGMNVTVLHNGYKAFRHKCLQTFEIKYNFFVLTGLTGSGKTEVLHELKQLNQPVVDIEYLASHKGSSFGKLGLPPQPTQEQFENILAIELLCFISSERIWIEDESRFIGKLRIPDAIFNLMRSAPSVMISRTADARADRILKEYGSFENEQLEQCTRAITKRMGGDQVKIALEALLCGDKKKWVKILLNYYDKTYMHSSSGEKKNITKELHIENESAHFIALKLAEENINN
ncbi:MAG: tRNA 2-selenouridine(34) synthase MnmH [Crocinitomicaceae bacterium]|nr:tRNA 2-selenouridine(34) synthase MnmH [Crocinitomicaceae bacterium]